MGEGGYILLNDYNEKEENRLQGIIRPPLVKDSYDGESNESNEHLFWNNKLILTKDNNEFYRIDLVLDSRLSENSDIQYPITIDMSWEMHRGKLPDSVIYSEMPQQNQYLTDISVIGKSVPYGLGRQYSRLRLHEYIIDDPQNIKSAYYGCYDLTGFSTPCIIAVCQMEDFWSSTGLTWDNRVKEGGEISQKIIKGGGYMLFDITKIARASMNDTSYNMDSFGILLKERSEENFYRIFASSDHCLFPVFQEVTFYQLPKQFNAYLKN